MHSKAGRAIQVIFLLILGGVGIMLIYFASVHSHQIGEKVEYNAKRVEMVIENQQKIIQNQVDYMKTQQAIIDYLNKPQLEYRRRK